MIDKGIVVLQNCMDEVVSGSYSDTRLAAPPDENLIIDMKVEDVTDIQVKEDPMPIKDEQEVSYIGMAISCDVMVCKA
jgi:hypothetical protein